jgi:hypothetical protein
MLRKAGWRRVEIKSGSGQTVAAYWRTPELKTNRFFSLPPQNFRLRWAKKKSNKTKK